MSEELEKGIPKGIIIGKKVFNPKEIEQHDKTLEKILKNNGVLKENQSIRELRHPK